jgi:hypothetical protein
MGLLRFHWDFFGPDAQRTAEHFLHHLDEFNKKEGVVDYRHWTTDHRVKVTATLECDERHLLLIRDRLRPVRGERVLEPGEGAD